MAVQHDQCCLSLATSMSLQDTSLSQAATASHDEILCRWRWRSLPLSTSSAKMVYAFGVFAHSQGSVATWGNLKGFGRHI